MATQVELKVREYAARERVTERTVWNWIAKGAVTVRKTPGGGIRIVEKPPAQHSSQSEAS